MAKHLLSIDEIDSGFKALLNERTGIVKRIYEVQRLGGFPDIPVYTADLQNLDLTSPTLTYPNGKIYQSGIIGGTGSSIQRDVARIKALCEALERYCNTIYDPHRVIVATRDELGDNAIDLNLFARGSDDEYAVAHPSNIFSLPNHQKPMRWVLGYSLITGKSVYLPYICVYLDSPYRYAGETFTMPITTGSAIAASYHQAIVTGMCEVIERDSLMITWLQQLPLPRIPIESIEDETFQTCYARVAACGIEQYFFDATLDLGIPTIYALQLHPNATVAALVMAATKLNPLDALIRVMEEAVPSRIAISNWLNQANQADPHDFRSFTRLEDGASYYAHIERVSAFDFLLNHSHERLLSEIRSVEHGDAETNLQFLLDVCRKNNLDVFVADITTPAAQQVGMVAVKVIIPQLIPLAVNHNLRYTASPRLYDVPRRMGYPVHEKNQLNPNPQPFA